MMLADPMRGIAAEQVPHPAGISRKDSPPPVTA